MVKFIKAYRADKNTAIELGVKAVSEKGAKARATTWLFTRMPMNAINLESVDADDIAVNGHFGEYRVIIEFDPSENILDKLKDNRLTQAIEDTL